MSLAANIPNMTSQEINSLAKNKFITEDIQLAIANCDYRRGIESLSLNPNLCQDAIDVLWEKRGYVLKTNMIVSGAVKLNDSEVIDFYNRYYARKRVSWRFIGTFLGRNCSTPVELLDPIYEKIVKEKEGTYALNWALLCMLQTNTCPLHIVVKIQNLINHGAVANSYTVARMNNEIKARLLSLSRQG